MKKFRSGMVFGVYDKIEERHEALLKYAASVCDKLVISVSSDKEVVAVFGSCLIPLAERVRIFQEFCKREKMSAEILARDDWFPKDAVLNCSVDAYVVSKSQYARFGKELEVIIKENGLKGKVVVV